MLESLHTPCMMGKTRRLCRVFGGKSGRTLIVPIDDSLIFGPFGGLADVAAIGEAIGASRPDGVLCFPGSARIISKINPQIDLIINLTASTVNSHHTFKSQVGSVDVAVAMDAMGVAAHVNITECNEQEMLVSLNQIINAAGKFGIPSLAIMYPRRSINGQSYNYTNEREQEPIKYVNLVCHACRIAVELGADIIKTTLPSPISSFERVASTADPIPVIVAGGELHPAHQALAVAAEALSSGARGISFGRNVFNREEPSQMIQALRALVHEGISLTEAKKMYRGSDS